MAYSFRWIWGRSWAQVQSVDMASGWASSKGARLQTANGAPFWGWWGSASNLVLDLAGHKLVVKTLSFQSRQYRSLSHIFHSHPRSISIRYPVCCGGGLLLDSVRTGRGRDVAKRSQNRSPKNRSIAVSFQEHHFYRVSKRNCGKLHSPSYWGVLSCIKLRIWL